MPHKPGNEDRTTTFTCNVDAIKMYELWKVLCKCNICHHSFSHYRQYSFNATGKLLTNCDRAKTHRYYFDWNFPGNGFRHAKPLHSIYLEHCISLENSLENNFGQQQHATTTTELTVHWLEAPDCWSENFKNACSMQLRYTIYRTDDALFTSFSYQTTK